MAHNRIQKRISEDLADNFIYGTRHILDLLDIKIIDFAKCCGISRQQYTRIMSKKNRSITVEQFLSIMMALSLCLDDESHSKVPEARDIWIHIKALYLLKG